MRRCLAAALLTVAVASTGVAAENFRLEDVVSLPEAAQLKPKVVAFRDRQGDGLADPATGLIRFEDWARVKPTQKQLLSLYPTYAEPTINVTVHGITKPYKEKLHVYIAEARFVIAKPPASVNLARYASIQFLERVDPAIKHRPIASADAMPYKDPESAHNRHPERRWCATGVLCIESRYQLEGRLPVGIRLANKIEEGGKKIAEYVEFQSEVRLLTAAEIEQAGLARLTGVGTSVVGALEQNIFHVNQMMQFGKFLAVLQPHPADATKTVVSAIMALAIETDVLEKKKEFENVPVLRNLVPAQVLVGKSSFNTGSSISAGLPDYARNRIKAVAAILDHE